MKQVEPPFFRPEKRHLEYIMLVGNGNLRTGGAPPSTGRNMTGVVGSVLKECVG